MKFEFTGNNISNFKILLDDNPITNCQSVDFHIDAQTQIPIVNLNLLPKEGNGIIIDNIEGFITIGNKIYKLTDVTDKQETITENAEDKEEQ